MNNTTNPQKIAIVTGSSSGIGLATAIHLAKNGFKTYATMRNPDKAPASLREGSLPIKVIRLDVTDDSSVNDAITEVKEKEGRIDVLVNNAGYALFGPAEDLGIDEVQKQFDTNFYGVLRATQTVLPTMREQKSGSIVNISSIAGYAGMPLMSAYSGTKFAVEGFFEALKAEVAPFGITISLIEPGAIKTEIISTSPVAKKALEPTSAYSDLLNMFEKVAKNLYKDPAEPSVVAELVLKAATSESPQFRYQAGSDSEMLFKERRQKPDAEFEKILLGFLMPPSVTG